MLAGAGAADAAWSTSSAANGLARAGVINAAAAPSAVVSGVLMNTVTVTWPTATFSNGAPVTSYTVRRYDAITGLASPVLAGCTGTIQATSCVETLVPPGKWQYTITAVAGTWHATESPKSTAVTTL